jgi:hypothetical protein
MNRKNQQPAKESTRTSSSASTTGADAAAPGQAVSGPDRREVESNEAQQSHTVHGSGKPGSARDVPRSEEAKNQEATSQQSRALSGTTAPRKV